MLCGSYLQFCFSVLLFLRFCQLSDEQFIDFYRLENLKIQCISPYGQFLSFCLVLSISFGSLKQACLASTADLRFYPHSSSCLVCFVLLCSFLAFNWFFGICRLRLCRLILLQQSCCDIGDKVFNRNSSGQLTQNKSTIQLFNSLCKLVELVEQQSCCQKLLKNKLLYKEKEQSLGPLVKKPSERHRSSTV